MRKISVVRPHGAFVLAQWHPSARAAAATSQSRDARAGSTSSARESARGQRARNAANANAPRRAGGAHTVF